MYTVLQFELGYQDIPYYLVKVLDRGVRAGHKSASDPPHRSKQLGYVPILLCQILRLCNNDYLTNQNYLRNRAGTLSVKHIHFLTTIFLVVRDLSPTIAQIKYIANYTITVKHRDTFSSSNLHSNHGLSGYLSVYIFMFNCLVPDK